MVWIIAPVLKVGANHDIRKTVVGLSWNTDDAVLPGDALEFPESVCWLMQVFQDLAAKNKIVGVIVYWEVVYACLQKRTVGIQSLSDHEHRNIKISSDQLDLTLLLTQIPCDESLPATHIEDPFHTCLRDKRR
jgi:hypothetical protein